MKNHTNSNITLQDNIENNNTATQSGSSVRAKPITNKRTYIRSVNDYLVTTSKLLTEHELKLLQHQYKKPICFYSLIGAWLSLEINDEYISNEQIRLLDDYMQVILEHPLHTGFIPFCDMLSFTIDICDKQLNKLEKSFRQFNNKDFKQSKKCRLVRNDMPNSPEFFTFYSKFSFGKDKNIYVYWGLSEKVRKTRPEHRLLKISFNPARFYRYELITFFDWLKSCRIFNYQKLMCSANVTRVDIAADLIGIHLKNMVIIKPKVNFLNYYLNHLSPERAYIGTMEFGKAERSKSIIYDKTFKILKQGKPKIKLPRFNNCPVPITRIERRIKMRDFKPLTLSKLHECPFFLDETEIYTPKLLRLLNAKQRKKVERYGFAFWLFIKTKDINELQDILEKINSKKLNVAENELRTLQHYALVNLRKVIIER